MLAGLSNSLKNFWSPSDNEVNRKRPLSCDSSLHQEAKRQRLHLNLNEDDEEQEESSENTVNNFFHWMTDITNRNYFIKELFEKLKRSFNKPPDEPTPMKSTPIKVSMQSRIDDTQWTDRQLTRAPLHGHTRKTKSWSEIQHRFMSNTDQIDNNQHESDIEKSKNDSLYYETKHHTNNSLMNTMDSSKNLSHCHKRIKCISSNNEMQRTFAAKESIRLYEKEQYKMLLQQYTTESLFNSHHKKATIMKDAQIQIDLNRNGKKKSYTPFKYVNSSVRKDKLDRNSSCDIIQLLKSNPLNRNMPRSFLSEIQSPSSTKSELNFKMTSTPKDNGKTSSTNDDVIVTKIEMPSKKSQNSLFFSEKWLEELKHTLIAQSEDREKTIRKLEERTKLLQEKREAKYASTEEDIKERLKKKSIAILEEKESEDDDNHSAAFPELTPEMEAVVEDALRPNPPDEILAEGFRLSVARRDMETLSGLNWLNDEIINYYMNLLMERSKLDNYPSAYAFNTFFYLKLLNSGHSALKRWTRKVDIFKYDMVLIPVHMGMHWCLAVIDFRHKKIQYYDSMGGQNAECLNALRTYLQDERMDKKKEEFEMSGWTLETIKNIPHQMNGSDCGMFALKYAEYITRDAKINFTQNDMPYFRRRMVYEILKKQLL